MGTLLFLLLLFFLVFSSAQQPYINNIQFNCYATNSSSALGYSCNGAQPSCASFLTFRAESPYLSPDLIASLLSSDAANISSLNSVPDAAALPAGSFILIPVPCSCAGRFYQHNASYALKFPSETYLTIANNTFQGLSTCQSLIDQNPFDSNNLAVGETFVVPLRCACPTKNQTKAGIKYLVSYLIAVGDDIPTIAQTFSADYQSVLSANELDDKSTIFPYTTLLIPLTSAPSKISISPLPSPPTVPNAPPPPSGRRQSHVGVYVGIAVGVFVLLLLGVLLCLFFFLKRRRQQTLKKESVSEVSEVGKLPFKKKMNKTPSSSPTTPSPLASSIRDMLDWMRVYTFEELLRATNDFAEDRRIRGSVYLGSINGESAAIKRVEGNVTNEINILKHISHSSVIKLSGICLHEGETFLVYEFAEMGALDDWLQHKTTTVINPPPLNWKQRIQIACDVAKGLNYLHNYTNPPYIHKNLKSSNVLLGRDFRAKVANFGLARQVEEGQHQITRHIVGTQGYMAPEYLEHGLITGKLDVFAFGVVLLELVSGKEAIFESGDGRRGEGCLWKSIGDVFDGEDENGKLRGFVDPCLKDDYPFELAFATAELAKKCVSRDPGSRPAMDELLISLSAIYNSTLEWDVEDGASSGSGSCKS